jgi:hypothetical protein
MAILPEPGLGDLVEIDPRYAWGEERLSGLA